MTEKYDSNVFLSNDDEESAFSSNIKYEVQTRNETRKLSFQLDAALGYRYFSENTIGSEYFGEGNISSTYKFDESDRFTWALKNTLRQNQIDSDDAFVPDNLRHENYFSTGPDLNLLLSKNSKLKTSIRYLDERTEGEDSYITRKKGKVTLEEKLSGNTFLSLSGEVENARLHNSSETLEKNGLSHQSVYVKYMFNGVANNYHLAFGATSTDTHSELEYYQNIFWKRKVNSLNSFSIEYLSDFNLGEDDINDTNLVDDSSGREYFVNDLAFYYDYKGSEWSTQLSLGYENKNYVSNRIYDTKYRRIGIDIKNFISQRLAIKYYLNLSESNRSLTNNEQKNSLIGANLMIRYNRNLTLELKGENDSIHNAQEQNHKNNSIYMIISYSN